MDLSRSPAMSFPLFFLSFETFDQNIVNDPVCFGFFRRHKVVPLNIFTDFLHALARVERKDLVESLPGLEDFLRLDRNISGLSLSSARGLMNHDLGVGQCVTLTFGSGSQEDCAHGCSLSHANR